MDAPQYLHLKPGDAMPEFASVGPFKAVLVLDCEVTSDWQAQVSEWLVRSGCRYMMAWGRNCSTWDDSVDEANLKIFDYGEIPEVDFVMTTWHENEPLRETFWFCQHGALHPSVELARTYILHISPQARADELLETFRAAQQEAG